MLGLTFYKGTTRISHLNHKIQNRHFSFLLPFFSGGGGRRSRVRMEFLSINEKWISNDVVWY